VLEAGPVSRNAFLDRGFHDERHGENNEEGRRALIRCAQAACERHVVAGQIHLSRYEIVRRADENRETSPSFGLVRSDNFRCVGSGPMPVCVMREVGNYAQLLNHRRAFLSLSL
jgi:hypothetical protein